MPLCVVWQKSTINELEHCDWHGSNSIRNLMHFLILCGKHLVNRLRNTTQAVELFIPAFLQQTKPSWWSWSADRSDVLQACGRWRWIGPLTHTDEREWSGRHHAGKSLKSISRTCSVFYITIHCVLTFVSGSLISTCMPSPGVDGRKELLCLSHSWVLYFPVSTHNTLNELHTNQRFQFPAVAHETKTVSWKTLKRSILQGLWYSFIYYFNKL